MLNYNSYWIDSFHFSYRMKQSFWNEISFGIMQTHFQISYSDKTRNQISIYYVRNRLNLFRSRNWKFLSRSDICKLLNCGSIERLVSDLQFVKCGFALLWFFKAPFSFLDKQAYISISQSGLRLKGNPCLMEICRYQGIFPCCLK